MLLQEENKDDTQRLLDVFGDESDEWERSEDQLQAMNVDLYMGDEVALLQEEYKDNMELLSDASGDGSGESESSAAEDQPQTINVALYMEDEAVLLQEEHGDATELLLDAPGGGSDELESSEDQPQAMNFDLYMEDLAMGDGAVPGDMAEWVEEEPLLEEAEKDEAEWWTEDFEIVKDVSIVEGGEEDEQGFEELLEWMEDEMLIDVAQHCECFPIRCAGACTYAGEDKEMITETDMQNIKLYALKYRHRFTNMLHSDLATVFRKELQLLTVYSLSKRIFKLANLKPIKYTHCEDSCMAFTGDRERWDTCICSKPKGRHSYYTLPIAPQLAALYASEGAAREQMEHTREMLETYKKGVYRDIHDGWAFRRLLGKKVEVNGVEQAHKFFEDARDVPLGLMTNRFQCFKRVHCGKSSAWPIILINYGCSNLTRMRIESVIPFALIPGPNQPKDFNSYLYPLKEELNQLAIGLCTYDGKTKEALNLWAYLICGTGDMPAVKHFGYMKGHSAKCPCRRCRAHGVYHHCR